MHNYTVHDIITKATNLATRYIAEHSLDNAERIVRLALEKIQAQQKIRKDKNGKV